MGKKKAVAKKTFSVCIPHVKIFDDSLGPKKFGEERLGEPVVVNLVITVHADDARYAASRVSEFLTKQIAKGN